MRLALKQSIGLPPAASSERATGLGRYSRSMPKNPDLVPTVIVDVNGRTTVVHKLRKLFGGSLSSSSTARIPAPAVPGPGARKITVVNSLMKMLPVPADKSQAKRLSHNLQSYFPLESLRWFAEVLSEGGPLAKGVGKHLTGAYSTQGYEGYVAKLQAEDVETGIRNNVMFYRLLDADNYAEVDSLVHGLGLSEPFHDVVDFTGLEEAISNQCVAVMTAARDLIAKYPGGSYEPSLPVSLSAAWDDNEWAVLKEPLFSFVMDNPDEVTEIVDAVVKYRTTDITVLRGLMTGIHLPLAGGAL